MQLSWNGDRLRIELNGWEKLWAMQFNYTFEIPIAHIRQVSTEKPPSPAGEYRLPGTFIPGWLKAGTYHSDRGREFWYVTRDRPCLTLDLTDEFYQKVILSLDQNDHWADQIRQRIEQVV